MVAPLGAESQLPYPGDAMQTTILRTTTGSLTTTITSEGPDPREAVRSLIRQLHAQGMSSSKIAEHLDAQGIRGPQGGTWHTTSVGRVLGKTSRKTKVSAPHADFESIQIKIRDGHALLVWNTAGFSISMERVPLDQMTLEIFQKWARIIAHAQGD